MSIEQGFAIRRNGTCLAGIEVGCGGTSNGMVGCCPSGLACPQAYNIDCCPSGTNCTTTIVETPRCSNSSWDLFDNGGYFCCEHGLAAYNNAGTNICASPGSSPKGVLLQLVKAAAVSSSSAALRTSPATSSGTPATAASASPTSVAPTSTPATAAPSQQPAQDSGPAVGAIAGGVVGGVAGLAILGLIAWLLMRRRRRDSTVENPYSAAYRREEIGGQDVPQVHQLDGTQRLNEVGPGKTTYAHHKEMPANSAPVELPADHQPPR